MILIGLLLIAVLAAMNAAPLAFCAMLLLGNLGVNISFWALFPGALAVKFAIHNVISAPTTEKS